MELFFLIPLYGRIVEDLISRLWLGEVRCLYKSKGVSETAILLLPHTTWGRSTLPHDVAVLVDLHCLLAASSSAGSLRSLICPFYCGSLPFSFPPLLLWKLTDPGWCVLNLTDICSFILNFKGVLRVITDIWYLICENQSFLR